MGQNKLPHHTNSLLVESWDTFKVSSGKIIKENFVKKRYPLRPPELKTNNQACAASIQASSVAKSEEINEISRCTFAPIEVQVTKIDDPMVVLRAKYGQQLSRNIVLLAAVYEAARKQTIIPIK